MKISVEELFKDEYMYTREDVKYTKLLVGLLEKELDKLSVEDYSRRVFSPRMHAFLNAEFIVDPNIRRELRVGLFEEPGKVYKAQIRYSSAFRKNTVLKKDVRTIAMRVYHEERNAIQDFLMGSSPYFRSRSVKQTYKGLKMLFGGIFLIAFGIFRWPRTALKAIKSRKITEDLLGIPFYSQTAYTYGSANRLVKYVLKPRIVHSTPHIPHASDPDFLKNKVKERLQNEEKIILDFFLQFQTSRDIRPEDPTIVWKGDLTLVGSVHIYKQDFDNEARFQEGQSLEFNVGNCLVEHKYFGAMNWARHIIYNKLSEYRKNKRIKQLLERPSEERSFINEKV